MKQNSISRRNIILSASTLAIATTHGKSAFASAQKPVALDFKIPSKINNSAQIIAPNKVALRGWLGARVSANASNRLLNINTAPLLAGFTNKPGSHPWIGEHIGKWLHAAVLAWANNGDPALKRKIDAAASELMAAQEPDGYLGTYIPSKRFGLYEGADWDVWSHKYCLIGLLTYYRYSHNRAALGASKMAADLLIDTFPAKHSILDAGTHKGMSSTSVLEPIVLLYNLTAEEKYLDFAKYIVSSWSETGGPMILESLLGAKKVNKTANAKAYEMLSNLVGLCDLARITGDNKMIEACLNAWTDITENHLHISGSTSRWEHFQKDGDYRCDNFSHIGETCVTTTWIQFNQSLLQLTGEARFGDELEKSLYNHLAAAQHPSGDDWSYYTALEGRKHYDKFITCCHSSGPRGMALAPLSTALLGREGNETAILINSFDTFNGEFEIGNKTVSIAQTTRFPHQGIAQIIISTDSVARFAIKIRAPNWAKPMQVRNAIERDGWLIIGARNWRNGDKIDINYRLDTYIIEGKGSLEGREALGYGPFILAADQNSNFKIGRQIKYALVSKGNKINAGFRAPISISALVKSEPIAPARAAIFKTFADVGADSGDFRVWLRERGRLEAGPFESVLIDGTPIYSRHTNSPAQVNDGDYETFVSTKTGQKLDQDWFGVELSKPKNAITFVFNHGRSSLDGGWFDTSNAKPIVEIKRTATSDWEEIGTLGHYPKTDAKTNPFHGEMPNWDFRIDLKEPVAFSAVRVRGAPSHGNNPAANYVTCRQITAFNWL